MKSTLGKKTTMTTTDAVVGPAIRPSPMPKVANNMEPELSNFLTAIMMSSLVALQTVPENKAKMSTEIPLDDVFSKNAKSTPTKDQNKRPSKKVVDSLKLLPQTLRKKTRTV